MNRQRHNNVMTLFYWDFMLCFGGPNIPSSGIHNNNDNANANANANANDNDNNSNN